MIYLQIYLACTHNFLLAHYRIVIVTRIITISRTETHIFHSLHPAGIAVSALSVHRCSADRDAVMSRKERDFQILSKRKAGYRKDESAKGFDGAYQSEADIYINGIIVGGMWVSMDPRPSSLAPSSYGSS